VVCGPRISDPLGSDRRCQAHGAERASQGRLIPAGDPRCSPEGWNPRRSRDGAGWRTSGRSSGRHGDAAGPRVLERRPWCPPVWSGRCRSLWVAAPATSTAPSTSTTRATTPPPPLGPEGGGPRSDDGGGADGRGGVGGRGVVAASAVEDPGETEDPGWMPCVSSSMTRSSRTSKKVGMATDG
jgi:hypothetical protein